MTREDLFESLNTGARWDVGVSINRSNSLPLDANSIFRSYEEAVAYASKNLTAVNTARTAEGLPEILDNAYIGQLISVVAPAAEGETVGAVGIYYIDQNMDLQEVGAKVVYDGKSITFNIDEEVEIAGFKSAAAQTLPRKTASGGIEWVPVSSVIEGATVNTVTEGEGKSIVTVDSTSDADGNVLSIKLGMGGYAAAAASTVPFKTDAGFAWQEVYTKTEVDAKVSAVFIYKGPAESINEEKTVITITEGNNIEASNDNIGWVYQIGEAEYASTGTTWEKLGTTTSLNDYYTKSETDTAISGSIATALANGDDKYVVTSEMTEALAGYTTTATHEAAVEAIDCRLVPLETAVNTTIPATYATQNALSAVDAKFADYCTGSEIKSVYATQSAVNQFCTNVDSRFEDVDTKIGCIGDYPSVVSYVTDAVGTEACRAEAAEGVLSTCIGEVNTAVATEKTRAECAEEALASRISSIEGTGTEVTTAGIYKFTTSSTGQVITAVAATGADIRALGAYGVVEGSILSVDANGKFSIDTSSITGDISDVTGRVETLEDCVAGNKNAIDGEIARACAAEVALSACIGEVSEAVVAEKGRAEGVEAGLETRLATLEGAGVKLDAKCAYTFTTNAAGQIISATALSKKDITDLGIPGQDTLYTAGNGLKLNNDTEFSIDTEVTATVASVKVVSDALEAEVDRATEAEDALQTAIDGKQGALEEQTAYAAGLYKITTNSLGQVTGATEVKADDITALGIPGQDTTYTVDTDAGLTLTDGKIGVNTEKIATTASVTSVTNALNGLKATLAGEQTIDVKNDATTLETVVDLLNKIALALGAEAPDPNA